MCYIDRMTSLYAGRIFRFDTPSRVLVGYSVAGLVIRAALSYLLVWANLDAYYWRPDGTLSDYPVAHFQSVQTDAVTGERRLVDPPGQRRLSRSEKMSVGFRQSLPAWIAGAFLGYLAGLIHLQIRHDLTIHSTSPEHADYDDSFKEDGPDGGIATTPTNPVPR